MKLYVLVLLLEMAFYFIMFETKGLMEFNFEFIEFELDNVIRNIYMFCGIGLMMYLVGSPIVYVFPMVKEQFTVFIVFLLVLLFISIYIDRVLKKTFITK